MLRRIIITALPALGLLCSCQSEMIQENTPAGRVLTVKATLPGADETRTHVTYGNQSVDYEFFRWDMEEYGAEQDDYLSLFNVTRLDDSPSNGGCLLYVTHTDGRSATFESDGSASSNIDIHAGDVLFVNYWETTARQMYEGNNLIYDPRKIFKLSLAAESNKPQSIVSNPQEAGSMSFMQGNLKMYDVVTVEQEGVIPDLHFKWLSGLIRVSLRNETGHDIYPTKLEVKYPGAESFFNAAICCSVNADSDGLIIYDFCDEAEDKRKESLKELYGSEDTKIYTDEIGCTLNGKNGTADAGGSIINGDTYDLYLSFVPRINNDVIGKDGLIINLVEEHQTDSKMTYSINVDDFKIPVEAGKRYWFNLTAVDDAGKKKLMFTSDWLAEQNKNAGEQTASED